MGQAAAVQGHVRLMLEAVTEALTPAGRAAAGGDRIPPIESGGFPCRLLMCRPAPGATRGARMGTVVEGDLLVPLSEVIGALSHALDLTEGQRSATRQRACMIGMELAERLDLPPDVRREPSTPCC